MTFAPPLTVGLDVPAAHPQLRIVGACLAELLADVPMADPEVLVYNVQLAVHEVCANIVDHAYGGEEGRIALSFALDPQRRWLQVELRDSGRSFDPGALEEPDLSVPRRQGYGLFLVHSLMDDVVYESASRGNCWRLAKQL